MTDAVHPRDMSAVTRRRHMVATPERKECCLGGSSCFLVSPYQQIGPDEFGPLDTDALEGPVLGRGDRTRAFLANKKRIAADGGPHARVPGDGTVVLQQLLQPRRYRHLHNGS